MKAGLYVNAFSCWLDATAEKRLKSGVILYRRRALGRFLYLYERKVGNIINGHADSTLVDLLKVIKRVIKE